MAEFDDSDFIVEWLTDDAGVLFRRGRVVESINTRYQRLEVLDTPALGRMFRLDGSNMTSERDEFFYHENIVHPGAIAQDAPRNALVIGGGDGGSTEELLKHPSIERVVMAELDPEVIRIARDHLQSVHRGTIDDPRVDVRMGDALETVGACNERFDVVVMDLTDPVGPAAALYTREFYRSIDNVLTPTGTVSLHLGAPFFHPRRFTETIRNLSAVFAIVRPHLVHVPLYGANWAMACASQRTDPLSLKPDIVDARIAERRIEHLQYYNGDVHRAGFALPNYIRALVAQSAAGRADIDS